MSSIRISLAPLEHRDLRNSVGSIRIAAREATVFVWSDYKTEPRDNLAAFIISEVLAEQAHNLLTTSELNRFDVQA